MTDEQIYHELVRTSPELPSLVDDLDLIDPSTGRRFGVSEQDERTRQRLVSVARRVLNQGRIYTSEQVVSLLGEKLRISRDRAVNGYRMMMTSGVLTSSQIGIRLAI
jgi:hypothetical protein